MYWLGKLIAQGEPLMYRWPVNKSLSILESSARGPHIVMLAEKYRYVSPEYDPVKIARGAPPGRFADFQNLGFRDSSFDVVIASDVFEHVRDDASGYREVLRVLKPGGTLILTVPYAHDQSETVSRVKTDGERDEMILEPEYHGGGGHTLTYRNYGRALLTLLRSTGFSVVHVRTDVAGFCISPQSVILAARGDYVDLSETVTPAGTLKPLGVLLPYRMYLLLKYNMSGFVSLLKQLLRS
jgi:SAM-dependent methyltransferase